MNVAEKFGIDLSTPGKIACPRCRRRGGDKSGNNLMVYGLDKGAYCWACEWTIPSAEHMEAMGWDDDDESEELVATREALTDEENQEIKGYTSVDGKDWRGIRKETNKFFGVRYEYDPETGEPCAQYVPTTMEGKLVGYRVRRFPKDFSGGVGKVGKEVDMIGEFRFKNQDKVCVLVGGETKLLNTYQMLKDDMAAKGKGDWEVPAVVCSTLGESGCYKQVQSRYKFFSQFEKVIVCMDADDAGEKATEEICKVLPKGKAYVMKMRLKDADDYVEAGKERDFITDFWKGYKNPWVPAGIVGSGGLGARIREAAQMPKIPLPPFMHKLQKKMAGGIPLKTIINMGSASGTGKSTIVDEMTYFWIFNSPYRPGIVSLESDAGQYGTKILSRHLQQKIDLLETVEEKMEFLDRAETMERENELYFTESGRQRFFLIDERDSGVDALKEQVEELIIGLECQLIILDPLQDILDGLDNDAQSMFMKWQKGMLKSHAVTFVNVNHVRKSSGGRQANSTGAELHEEDMQGTSGIFKSGACNLLFMRDKEAEDPIERNTTRMKASKIRWTGITGEAGEYYYDNQTHTMWDKDDWMKAQPPRKF